MWRRSMPLAVVGGWSLACANRKEGPNPDELVAWVIADATLTTDGCDDAAPIVEALRGSLAPGTGLVYGTNADASAAEAQSCPLEDGAFDLEACEGIGQVAAIDGDTLTWELEDVVVDEPPCRLSIGERREIVDHGPDALFSSLFTVAATSPRDCDYVFQGAPVAPDGCAVTVVADLDLAAWSRKL